MKIEELEKVYAKLPQVSALAHEIGNSQVRRIFLDGLLGSSAPMLFGSVAAKCSSPLLFILQDAEEAGYFYHDLTQLLGQRRVLFFPSSYRRAIKYGQLDPASQILRTEVMTHIDKSVFIVTYPEALAEMVVPKQTLSARTLLIERG
jgi:transcription-repair coupling factor (superfamily II helicase)